MKLITAHRVLIAAAAGMFLLTAAWSFSRGYWIGGLACVAVAAAFAAYHVLVLRKKNG